MSKSTVVQTQDLFKMYMLDETVARDLYSEKISLIKNTLIHQAFQLAESDDVDLMCYIIYLKKGYNYKNLNTP